MRRTERWVGVTRGQELLTGKSEGGHNKREGRYRTGKNEASPGADPQPDLRSPRHFPDFLFPDPFPIRLSPPCMLCSHDPRAQSCSPGSFCPWTGKNVWRGCLLQGHVRWVSVSSGNPKAPRPTQGTLLKGDCSR